MNLPLNFRLANGFGTGSRDLVMSATTPATTLRIPRSAASGDKASQLKLGNSAQRPTYSRSSSDQVTRYVYPSVAERTTTKSTKDTKKTGDLTRSRRSSLIALQVESWSGGWTITKSFSSCSSRPSWCRFYATAGLTRIIGGFQEVRLTRSCSPLET